MTKDKQSPLSKTDLDALLEGMQAEDVSAHAALESSIDFSRPVDISTPSAREMIDGLLKADDALEADYGIKTGIVLPEKYVSDHLERDGCNLIRGALVLMTALGYPADVRDFNLTLMALSDGHYSDEIEIYEDQLRLHLGWSAGVLRRKRRALEAHEESQGFTLVQIREGEMDHEHGKWKPTAYRVGLVKYAADLVRLTRGRNLWRARGRAELMDAAADEEIKEIAKEVVSSAPNSKIVRRKAKKKSVERHYQTLIDRMESAADKARDSFISYLEKYLECQLQRGIAVERAAAELQDVLNPVLRKWFEAFPDCHAPISGLEIALRVNKEKPKSKRGNGRNARP